MARVFVSYSWRDAPQAHQLAEHLFALGHTVWIDHKGLDLAQPLAPQLRNAIHGADAFVLVQSRHAETSGWVKYEKTCARAFRKPMLVVASRRLEYDPNQALRFEGAITIDSSAWGVSLRTT